MALEIFDEAELSVDQQLLDKIYLTMLQHFGLEDIFEVELTITDCETIQQVNLQTRGVDSVTDVLSFPTLNVTFPFEKDNYSQDIDPMTGKIMLGEIMLCSQRASEQAVDFGHSYERECGYLFLHGLLHLMGFDHMVESDKATMRGHEDQILEVINLHR